MPGEISSYYSTKKYGEEEPPENKNHKNIHDKNTKIICDWFCDN